MKLNYETLAKYGFDMEAHPEHDVTDAEWGDISDTMVYRDGVIVLTATHIGKGDYELTSVIDRNGQWYEDPSAHPRFNQLFRLGSSIERIFEELEAPITPEASWRYAHRKETDQDRTDQYNRQEINLRKEPWRKAA